LIKKYIGIPFKQMIILDNLSQWKRKEKIITEHDSSSAIFFLILSFSSSLHYLSFVYNKNLPLSLSNPLLMLLQSTTKRKTSNNDNDKVIILHPFPTLVTDDRTRHDLLYIDDWTSEQREETDDGIIDYSCI